MLIHTDAVSDTLAEVEMISNLEPYILCRTNRFSTHARHILSPCLSLSQQVKCHRILIHTDALLEFVWRLFRQLAAVAVL